MSVNNVPSDSTSLRVFSAANLIISLLVSSNATSDATPYSAQSRLARYCSRRLLKEAKYMNSRNLFCHFD